MENVTPLERRAQIALFSAELPDETRTLYYQKIIENPEMQQIVIDLLEPFCQTLLKARAALNSDQSTTEKHTSALNILGLDTSKQSKYPPTLHLEYSFLVYDSDENLKQAQKNAVETLMERYGFRSFKATCQEIRRQRKSFPFFKGVPPPNTWE